MIAIQAYATKCRDVLREGSDRSSIWFFDERADYPDLAILRSFELSPAKDLVNDYLVYFEIHISPGELDGWLSFCALEIGPSLYKYKPSQGSVQIFNNSISLIFETGDDKHHLGGSLGIKRNQDGGISGLGTLEYTLTLIHPGTKEPTRNLATRDILAIKRTEINCPKCLGKGQYASMSIPKEAYARGLTGYALYSENTVCSHTGCSLCGGSGTSYEEWYVKETCMSTAPQRPFVRGSGRIVIGGNNVT
ncbi:hypothetical protein Cmtc_49910 [Cupriavidus sp. TKC]|uniref:hypothetical protein n=1 Tax=Cupriavidus sp. TKC TaxID=2880159 RepID=UPI0025A7EB14|nr:hypothetical protein [Cupriavidus sp. TKC]GMG93771.1 hypothetical protein Cmtc_49910 [Cupriavidus sp. TKC]